MERGEMNDSSLMMLLKQINWDMPENRKIANQLALDAKEYFIRVVDHIYTGNEIRADIFMDASEKQEEIKLLDRKRTAAHDKLLNTFESFLGLLQEQKGFDAAGYKLENRTQIADFVASIAFELIGLEPASGVEGSIRDELAEKIHSGDVSFEQISDMTSLFKR